MPYTPPNTFTTGTTLEAADLQGNLDALRIYTHDGIIAGDVAAGVVDTRHIQAPYLVPAQGLQHGVTGWQGSQWPGSTTARVSFVSRFLAGENLGGRWTEIQDTAFQVSIRAPATILFHWWTEVQGGPDTAAVGATATEDRFAWIAPYVANVSLVAKSAAQECANNYDGFNPGSPEGAERVYTILGESQMAGTYLTTSPGGTVTVGLAATGSIDRAAVINWGVTIEAWYL
jgi:hypothetical protein